MCIHFVIEGFSTEQFSEHSSQRIHVDSSCQCFPSYFLRGLNPAILVAVPNACVSSHLYGGGKNRRRKIEIRSSVEWKSCRVEVGDPSGLPYVAVVAASPVVVVLSRK